MRATRAARMNEAEMNEIKAETRAELYRFVYFLPERSLAFDRKTTNVANTERLVDEVEKGKFIVLVLAENENEARIKALVALMDYFEEEEKVWRTEKDWLWDRVKGWKIGDGNG